MQPKHQDFFLTFQAILRYHQIENCSLPLLLLGCWAKDRRFVPKWKLWLWNSASTEPWRDEKTLWPTLLHAWGHSRCWLNQNIRFLKKHFVLCVGPCIDTHLVDADNDEMIARCLVFSVHVKVYALLKWEPVRVSSSPKGVISGLWVGHSQ